MNKTIRHGEIVLQPVNTIPKGKVSKTNTHIVGHSETGHHHILESPTVFDVVDKGDLYLRLFEPAKLVHRKDVDAHKTLPVAPGKYKVIYKTEYNPFEKVRERVMD